MSWTKEKWEGMTEGWAEGGYRGTVRNDKELGDGERNDGERRTRVTNE